jgi:hypothetical protein
VNLRKTAGLLAVTGLIVGLLGSGVGAAFVDQVIGTENIAVGTFDCQVTGVTDNGSNGNWFDANSATYNAPTILSSAPGNAPFTFTVKNFGTIPMALSVSGPTWGGTLDGSFSGTAPVLSAVTLAGGASATVTTGIQWTALDSADLGDYGSATWTVACSEYQTIVHVQPGIAGTGWYGWSCPSGTTVIGASVDSGSTVLGLAKPGVTTDGFTYPVYPHHTYVPPEEGAVVHNAGGPATQTLTVYCTL